MIATFQGIFSPGIKQASTLHADALPSGATRRVQTCVWAFQFTLLSHMWHDPSVCHVHQDHVLTGKWIHIKKKNCIVEIQNTVYTWGQNRIPGLLAQHWFLCCLQVLTLMSPTHISPPEGLQSHCLEHSSNPTVSAPWNLIGFGLVSEHQFSWSRTPVPGF